MVPSPADSRPLLHGVQAGQFNIFRRFWQGTIDPPDPRVHADPAAEEAFQPLKKPDFAQEARCGRGQAALEARIAISYWNDSDKPDQVTSLNFLIRALRADLG